MKNKQHTFHFWSLLIDEYLEVTFEYWWDLDRFDKPKIDFIVTEISKDVPNEVKKEIDEHISFELSNLIED